MLSGAEVQVDIGNGSELPSVGVFFRLLTQVIESKCVKRLGIGEVALVARESGLRSKELRARGKVGPVREIDRLDNFADEGS